MSTPPRTQGRPKTILLATDMSSRCDRALDRAAQLCALWDARLIVVTAVEPDHDPVTRRDIDDLPSWRRPADRRAVVRSRLLRDLKDEPRALDVRVVEGDPVDAALSVAASEGADLIVTGVARDEPLGRYILGSTVERLARRSTIPLLIVKARVRPYDEIVVATDFSLPSRHALAAAAQLFPQAALTLLHAWELPFAGFLDKGDVRDEWKALEQKACDEFVAQSGLSDEQRGRLQVLVEHGSAESLVYSYMLDQNVDLVVLGAHGRSGLFDARLGGRAKRILEYAPGDILLVREPQAVAA